MTSCVNVCDVKRAEKRYACLKIVNEYDMRFISSMPWVTCVQVKGVPAEGIYFPGGNKSFLGKNKITDFICLINRDIFPPNM